MTARGPPTHSRQELVQMISDRTNGEIRTHPTVDRHALHSAARGDKETLQQIPPNPVDRLRDELMALLEDKGGKLLIVDCPRDCYQHPDGRVVLCYMQLERIYPMSEVNFNELDYTDLDAVKVLPRFVLSGMALGLGLETYKAHTLTTGTVAKYVVDNYKDGLVWNADVEPPDSPSWVEAGGGGEEPKKPARQPKKGKPGPKPKRQPKKAPAGKSEAPAPTTSDDLTEVIGRLEALESAADLQAANNEVLKWGILFLIKLTGGPLGLEVEAETLEEAKEALGE